MNFILFKKDNDCFFSVAEFSSENECHEHAKSINLEFYKIEKIDNEKQVLTVIFTNFEQSPIEE